MARINANYNKLAAGYLFPEIARRTAEFVNANDGVEVMRLGIGDTTEPLTQAVLEGLHGSVDELSSPDTYSGYGDGEGKESLRKALADRYGERGAQLDETEVFISDGAKSDSANIQSLFSNDAVICVQDPAYPVYVDTNVIGGRTGDAVDGQYEGLVYLPCTEANGFVPEPPSEHVDLIYLCNPNNPTGAVATKSQLEAFVTYAREHKAVIFFAAAYSAYITDPDLPRSIYELEGAETCAIELNSFSKDNGFTGLRLGWAGVPQALVAEDAEPGKLNTMWRRRQNTFFNGPANIVQDGAAAVLVALLEGQNWLIQLATRLTSPEVQFKYMVCIEGALIDSDTDSDGTISDAEEAQKHCQHMMVKSAALAAPAYCPAGGCPAPPAAPSAVLENRGPVTRAEEEGEACGGLRDVDLAPITAAQDYSLSLGIIN